MLVDPPKQRMQSGQFPLSIVGVGLSLPTTLRPVAEIFQLEAGRLQQQLDALGQPFRERLLSQLGVSEILREETSCSRERGLLAATQALEHARTRARDVSLIIDYTTYAADTPALWSLGHDIQSHLGATNALVIAARGSGCCGLHLALRTAQAFLQTGSRSSVALLIAADRAPDTGRVCLPIAVMSDAASALVVAREEREGRALARLRAIELQCSGRYADVLTSSSEPPAIEIDAARFEQELMPIHFVALTRVLSRALQASQISISDVSALVYPNTTQLDRQSACRALGFQQGALVGPGPSKLGHAFANDLIINGRCWLEANTTRGGSHSAWLAAGSGFTWAAAIIEAP